MKQQVLESDEQESQKVTEQTRRVYEPPALQEDDVFERAVYAACKLSPMSPQFCNPIGVSS